MATWAIIFTRRSKQFVQNGINMIRAAAGEICRHFNHQIALSQDTNLIALMNGLDRN